MKSIFLKCSILIVFLLQLSSCVMYYRAEKFEKKVKINQGQPLAFGDFQPNPFFNPHNYTKETILKLFGDPVSIEKKDDIEILSYQITDKPLAAFIGIIIIPIKYQNEDNIYTYSFEFSKNKLTRIVYQDVREKTTAFGLMFPPFINQERVWDIQPFNVQKCNPEHQIVFALLPHLPSDPKITKRSDSCLTNKLLDINMRKIDVVDSSQVKKGITRYFTLSSVSYNQGVLTTHKKTLEENFKLPNLESERIKDVVVQESLYKNKQIDCKVLSIKSKDTQANNKNKHPYLILDSASAVCFTQVPDFAIYLINSNRYPEEIKMDTLAELNRVLKTIKLDLPIASKK